MIDDLKDPTNETYMSSADSTEKRMMYSKSDSSIIVIDNDADEIIQELLTVFA